MRPSQAAEFKAQQSGNQNEYFKLKKKIDFLRSVILKERESNRKFSK